MKENKYFDKKLVWIPALLILILCTSFASAALTDDLVAYYSFDDDEDDDYSTHTGAVSGATHTSSGKIGYAYDFESSSSDYLAYGDEPDFELQSFTINAWVKTESFSDNMFIFGGQLRASGAPNGYFLRFNTDGSIRLATYGMTDTNVQSDETYTADTGEWHMVTGVVSPTGRKIYYDGSLIESDTETGTIVYDNYHTHIGAGTLTSSTDRYAYFDGLIDEVGIWDDDLSTTEIEELYNDADGRNPLSNTAPTVPTGSTIARTQTEITATGAGSTDADVGDTVSYYYEFRCNTESGSIIQALSTDTSYTINDGTCGIENDVYVRIWAYDGTDYSSTYEPENIEQNFVPTTPSGSTITPGATEITATGAGSTDADTWDSITYLYAFYCDEIGGDLIQAKSFDNTYTVNAGTCALDKDIYAKVFAYDGKQQTAAGEWVSTPQDQPPNPPTGSTINTFTGYNKNIVATGAGSVDPDGNPVTYYYQFNCDDVGDTLLQAKSTTNTYNLTTACYNNTDAIVAVSAYDGTVYSTDYDLTYTVPKLNTNLSDFGTQKTNFTISFDAIDFASATTASITTNDSNIICANQPIVGGSATLTCVVPYEPINTDVTFTPSLTDGTITITGLASTFRITNINTITFKARYLNNTYITDFNITDEDDNVYAAVGGIATIYELNNTEHSYSYYAPNTMNLNNTAATFTAVTDYLYNFTVYTKNKLNITIYDEITEAILQPNKVNLELISTIYAENFTTINGTINLELLSPTVYTIRYSSENYSDRFYYYNLTDRSFNTVNLYLLNESLSDEITMTTYDSSGFNELEDVYIKYLKYFTSDNSYRVVGMGLSNYEGISKAQVQKNTEFYKFFLYYPDLTTLKTTTSPSYIFQDNINFRISTTELAGARFANTMGITSEIEYNDDTGNFRYEFSNDEGSDVVTTVEVHKIVAGKRTLVNSKSSTSSAGTVLVSVPSIINDTQYIATAKTKFNGDSTQYVTNQLSYVNHNPNNFGATGIFILIILTLVMLMVGYFSLSIMIALVPIPLLFCSMLNIVQFDIRLAMGVQLVFLIISLMVKV